MPSNATHFYLLSNAFLNFICLRISLFSNVSILPILWSQESDLIKEEQSALPNYLATFSFLFCPFVPWRGLSALLFRPRPHQRPLSPLLFWLSSISSFFLENRNISAYLLSHYLFKSSVNFKWTWELQELLAQPSLWAEQLAHYIPLVSHDDESMNCGVLGAHNIL